MACHTSPKQGKPYAGGYAIASPLGEIWASNITPSKSHGIGLYSEDDFAKAVREGVRKDGAHLYPAMPYTSYAKLTDEDIHALYSYFHDGGGAGRRGSARDRTAVPLGPPVHGGVEPAVPGQGDVQARCGQECAMESRRVPGGGSGALLQLPQPARTDGHVQEVGGKAFAGGSLGDWYAPNITSHPTSGIGSWSDAELAQYLKTGRVAGKAQAGGGMAEAVSNSLSKLQDEDIAAIVAYLRTVPAVADPDATRAAFAWGDAAATPGEQPVRGTGAALASGGVLYSGLCASCHGSRGEGSRDGYYPSLVHNTTVGMTRHAEPHRHHHHRRHRPRCAWRTRVDAAFLERLTFGRRT